MTREPTADQTRRDDLGVMTFNLRFAHAHPPDLWPDRRPVVKALVEAWSPDLLGTQEGLYLQLRDMQADLPGYDWIGLGREGGSHGEFMAVFYRRERFEPLEFDHFWLSDTPERIASRTWGNHLPRMATWVRLLDRIADRELVLLNTHLDHRAEESRWRGAELIASRADAWGFRLPLVVTGDFNSAPSERARRILADAGLEEMWRPGADSEGMGTFHGFRGVEAAVGRDRIDWILARGPLAPLRSEIVTFHRDGQYPSDHFPVFARLRWTDDRGA